MEVLYFVPYMTRILRDDAVIRRIREAPYNYTWIPYACAFEIQRLNIAKEERQEWRDRIQHLLSAMIRTGLDMYDTSISRLKGGTHS